MVNSRFERKRLWESMTRQGIVEAVVGILAENGVQALTMDRVAERAGVAKGTLYVYYKSKQDLLKATIEATLGPLIKELNGVLDSDLQPDEKIRELVRRHLGFFDQHRPLFRVLLYELTQVRWKKFGTSRYQAFLNRLSVVLEEGCKQGFFHELNPVRVAAMLMEADIAVIHQRLRCDNPGPVDQDAELVTRIFLRGMSEAPLEKKILS